MNSISDWVTSSYFSTIGYLSFGENDGQITRNMRIYKSEKDWFGTQQTLVLDKSWLKSLIVNLQNLLEAVEMGPSPVVQLSMPSEMPGHTSDQLEDSDKLETSVKMLKSFLPLLEDIYTLYSSPDSRTIFEYFFGSNVGKSAASFRNSSKFYSELRAYAKEVDSEPKAQKILDALEELFSQENCDHLLEMGIMFGFYPALIGGQC